MKKFINLVCGIMLVSVCSNTIAGGWSFDSVKKILPTGEKKSEQAEESQSATAKDTGMDKLVDQSEAAVIRYAQSVLRLVDAQANFAESLGAKKEADDLRVQSEALRAGDYSKGSFKSQAKISKKTNKLIQERLTEKQELDEEQKKLFLKGMAHYAIGLKETKEFSDEVGPLYDSLVAQAKELKGGNYLGSAGLLFNSKFATLGYLAKNTPGLLKDHSETGGMVVKFAQSNDLDVPKELEDEAFL